MAACVVWAPVVELNAAEVVVAETGLDVVPSADVVVGAVVVGVGAIVVVVGTSVDVGAGLVVVGEGVLFV